MIEIKPNQYKKKKSERELKAEQAISKAMVIDSKVQKLNQELKELEKRRNILIGCASHFLSIKKVERMTAISYSTVSRFKQLYFKELKDNNKPIPVINKLNRLDLLIKGREEHAKKVY